MLRLPNNDICLRGDKVIPLLFLTVLSLLLIGCVKGRVTTVWEAPPPQPPLFTVIPKDSLGLKDRTIVGRIEKKLSELGFMKAVPAETANIAVHYQYLLGPGQLQFSSGPDGGSSSTTYPRTFEISVIDIEKSKATGKAEFIWQGELYSAGHTSDMTRLAPSFIDVLFENYGKTVTNQGFWIPRD